MTIEGASGVQNDSLNEIPLGDEFEIQERNNKSKGHYYLVRTSVGFVIATGITLALIGFVFNLEAHTGQHHIHPAFILAFWVLIVAGTCQTITGAIMCYSLRNKQSCSDQNPVTPEVVETQEE